MHLKICEAPNSLRAQAVRVAVEQDQIEFTLQDLPARWPNQQDALGLHPAHFVAGREEVVVRVEVEDLFFHRGTLCYIFALAHKARCWLGWRGMKTPLEVGETPGGGWLLIGG